MVLMPHALQANHTSPCTVNSATAAAHAKPDLCRGGPGVVVIADPPRRSRLSLPVLPVHAVVTPGRPDLLAGSCSAEQHTLIAAFSAWINVHREYSWNTAAATLSMLEREPGEVAWKGHATRDTNSPARMVRYMYIYIYIYTGRRCLYRRHVHAPVACLSR